MRDRPLLLLLLLFVVGLYEATAATTLAADEAPPNLASAYFMKGSAQTNQKVIKDPAEYNAYITALNTQDPAAKAAAMEVFVKQYPQSIVLTDALEQAMAAYQQAGNVAKVEELAKRILQLTPNNLRSLAIVTALDRDKATGGEQAALKEMCRYAQTGLQQVPSWQKPEGLTDADFGKLESQMADIFNGAAGFCALQAKNYPQARDFLTKAVQTDPTNLQDVYQLAVADLEMSPMDLNGLWYCGQAITMANQQDNAQAVRAMVEYCKAKYQRYHGSEDGWDQVLGGSAESTLPSDFSSRIKRAPTPCELAVEAVQQNDPGTLSFADWEFILSKAKCSPANKRAADKVWQAIQDMQKGGEVRLKIPIKVIAATQEVIDGAITDENQQAGKADITVHLETPVIDPPAAGSSIEVIGALSSYVPDPFMFAMTKGELPQIKAPPDGRAELDLGHPSPKQLSAAANRHHADKYNFLGDALYSKGDMEGAITEKALTLMPKDYGAKERAISSVVPAAEAVPGTPGG